MKVFIGTFNMNGQSLDAHDASKWFQDAPKSDLVIISLQECPTYRQQEDGGYVVSGNDLQHYMDTHCESEQLKDEDSVQHLNRLLAQYNQTRCISAPRPCFFTYGPTSTPTPTPSQQTTQDGTENNMKKIMTKDAQLLFNIQQSLSSNHSLVVDIAMGEEPSSIEVVDDSNDKKKEVKWYGFIRLLVFATQDLASTLLSSHDEIIPMVSPCGQKSPSSYPTQSMPPLNKDAHQYQRYSYPPMSSPDKGCVSVLFPRLKMLCCSLHLAGTNSRSQPEAFFDTIRIQQLHQCLDVMNHAYQSYGSTTNTLEGKTKQSMDSKDETHRESSDDPSVSILDHFYPILIGDLNFRCEMYTEAQDKCRGGRDFKQVHDIITSGNDDAVQHLFWNHDHLVQLLNQYNEHKGRSSTASTMPSFLFQDMVDVVAEAFKMDRNKPKQCDIVMPTFTFLVDIVVNKDSQKPTTTRNLRSYSDKRTPSWTDRILIHKKILCHRENNDSYIDSVKGHYEICSSDHVPLSCSVGVSTK